MFKDYRKRNRRLSPHCIAYALKRIDEFHINGELINNKITLYDGSNATFNEDSAYIGYHGAIDDLLNQFVNAYAKVFFDRLQLWIDRICEYATKSQDPEYYETYTKYLEALAGYSYYINKEAIKNFDNYVYGLEYLAELIVKRNLPSRFNLLFGHMTILACNPNTEGHRIASLAIMNAKSYEEAETIYNIYHEIKENDRDDNNPYKPRRTETDDTRLANKILEDFFPEQKPESILYKRDLETPKGKIDYGRVFKKENK